MVDVNYLRVAGTPDDVHFALGSCDVIWCVVHDFKLYCSSDMYIHWGERLDYALHSDSEDVVDMGVLHKVNLDVALTSTLCLHL